MSGPEQTVSVVIPAYQEAQSIGRIVRECLEHTPGLLEVIVVDDGSSDGTHDRAEAAGARVLRLTPNQGKGIALMRGVREARGDAVVVLDGDGQDLPSDIPKLLHAMDPGVDCVIGSRFLGEFSPGAITRVNRLGTRALTETMNVLFRTRLTDPVAGFRAFRRSALEGLQIQAVRYEVEFDMLLSLLRRGAKGVEVPVQRLPRSAGQSKLSAVVDGSRMLATIFRHRLAALLAR